MNISIPHYLLRSQASQMPGQGHWRFVLQPIDGSAEITATDVEPDVWGERLDLLTIIRALEALDQPSRVTLVGCTRYVQQGIQYGLTEWKENGWRWEWFGQMVPVRDGDLWQRMDQVLQFHSVECVVRRLDALHGQCQGPHWTMKPAETETASDGLTGANWVKCYALGVVAWCGLLMRKIGAQRLAIDHS